jgi:hypothetical protein
VNAIGKLLVLFNTFLCLLGLAVAILIYWDFVDWGRSQPRLLHGEQPKAGPANDQRIASEYDKSKVLFDHAVRSRDLTIVGQGEPPLRKAEDSLHEAQARLAQNHQYYAALLKSLRSGTGDIDVKALPAEGLATDTPNKAVGKLVPSVKLDGLNRSIAVYQQELKNEQDKLDPIQEKLRALADANSKLSYQLSGKDENGKRLTHGVFDLINAEYAMQQKLLQEREQVQPRWASTIEEARRFGSRRSSLEYTLGGLQQALKERDKQE